MEKGRNWRRVAGVVLSAATLASLAVCAPSAMADDAADGTASVQSFGTAGQTGVLSQTQQQADAARKALQEKNDKLQAEYDAQQQSQPDAATRDAAQITVSNPSAPVYTDLSTGDYAPKKELPTFKLSDNGMIPYVNVTARGLQAGVEYCAEVSPWSGIYATNGTGGGETCAKATGSTVTFKVFLEKAAGAQGYYERYGNKGFAAVAKKSDIDKEESTGSLVEPIAQDTTGVPVTFAQIKDLISITSLNVEDIGAQTVGLKYGYKIDSKLAGKVLNLCPLVALNRAYSINISDMNKVPKNTSSYYDGYWGSYRDGDTYCLGTDVVSDDDTSTDADAKRENLHKVHTTDLTNWNGSSEVKYGTATYQGWTRYAMRDFSDLNNKLSGTIDDVTLTWLNPNTKYGNWGGTFMGDAAIDMAKKGETSRTDPWSYLRTSLQVKFTDGSYYMSNNSRTNVPDFTTKSLAAAAESQLNSGNANNVNGANGGVAAAKSKYRIYIDNLSKECRALADKGESMCSWAAYIYSSPTRLSTPDGQNALVRKDPQSKRYYVDVNTPAGYQGTHKIALFNQDGKLQGWTSVRFPVSKFDDVTSSTPHAADIQWLAGTAITEGWKNAKGGFDYRGMSTVKRQDMAAFLYRLAGSPSFDVSKVRNPFSDVTEQTSHYQEILWLYSTGISTGWKEADGKTTFRGMSTVKRQDMAAFLHRFADYRKANPTLGKAVPFADVTTSTPHSEDIAWLAKTGVTTGWAEKDGTVTYRGMSDVKRQDMAAFLHRMNVNVTK